mmetsp:Transcript_23400/g.39958  ORF Transcript_23400/g.39958 Transcript_23400/m.39958 type:complete len:282 (-) Transcript_23400:277-1122(-)
MRNQSRLLMRSMTLVVMLLSWRLWQVRRRRRRKLSTLLQLCTPFRNWQVLGVCSVRRPQLSFRKRRQSMSSVALSMSCRNTLSYNSSFRIRWKTKDSSTALLRSRETATALRWLVRLLLRALSMERLSMRLLLSLATPMFRWPRATLNVFFALESFRWIPSQARMRVIHLKKSTLLRSWNLLLLTLWPRCLCLISGRDGSKLEILTKSSRSLPCNSRSRMMRLLRSLISLACSHAMERDISKRERGARNLICFISVVSLWEGRKSWRERKWPRRVMRLGYY